MAKTKNVKKQTNAQTQAFYIKNAIYELLIKEAAAEDRSKSYMVNKILEDYFLRKEKAKKRKRQAAKAARLKTKDEN